MKSDHAVNAPGGPFADHAAVAVVGDSLSDVAREALKIARVESQSRPVLLVDLLGQGSALDEMFPDDDLHGVSDAARYGVSLGKVARQVPKSDSLFVVSGGVESAQADDVLSDHLWGSWSDQCRRAGALLVVAAPADLHDVGKAIDQLDGLVMIGDGALPSTHAPVIGRVPATRRVPVADAPPPRSITPAEKEAVEQVAPRRMDGFLMGALIALGITGLVAGGWWLTGNLRDRGVENPAPPAAAGETIIMPGDPVTEASATGANGVVVGGVPWSVEFASVNTLNGAMARVRQAIDSVPVPTFAATQPGGGSVWYRMLAGAFPTSEAADSLLTALRARGAIEPAAGRVVQTPLAWLLEEGVLEEQLAARLFGWRQQGLPAYALLDRNGTTRIYFGAFENETEARLLTPMLDSLNLYATLAKRIGSIR
jgi:hypothetical protein